MNFNCSSVNMKNDIIEERRPYIFMNKNITFFGIILEQMALKKTY